MWLCRQKWDLLKKKSMANLISKAVVCVSTLRIYLPARQVLPNVTHLSLAGRISIVHLDLTITWLYLSHVRNLNNYFDFHVCLSIRPFVRSSVRVCVRKLAKFPAVVWQNVTNKSCLVCVQSVQYASWLNLTPQLDCCCQGKAEVCALAHLGCTRAAGTS